jgi:hypothetical protein
MRVLTYRKNEGKRLGAVRHQRKAERVAMPITKGDTVRVMRGEDKGKEGKVLRVFTKTGRITVEGINIVKRHRKARRAEEQSAIIEMPAPDSPFERDAARPEERGAHAHAGPGRCRRHQGTHQREERGCHPAQPLRRGR